MTQLITPRLMTLRKTAMKEKDQAAKSSLQALAAAFKTFQLDARAKATDKTVEVVLTEADEVGIVVKQIKQRQESVKMFQKAGREDLRDAEEAEIKYLEQFLPQALTEEEVIAGVDAVFASFDEAPQMAQMGQIMAKLGSMKGKTDMGKLSGIVRSKIMKKD